jgi:CubicO group peptidase (beta-lactamase class C family)
MANTKHGFDLKRLERITDHLQRRYIEPGRIAGCQTLIARHGEVVYEQTLGLADLARATKLRDDAIFRIYSMTKPITSVALMMLHERGLFQLNDPIVSFVPEWSEQRAWVSGEGPNMQLEPLKRPITFRDLLTHTGGLTYGGGLPGVGVEHPVDHVYREHKIRTFPGKEPLAVFLRKLGRMPLMFQPGTHFMYSISTDVCGALVELLSGQTFDAFLREHIFEPLQMHDTAFFVPEGKRERFAANYQRRPDKTLDLIDDPTTSQFLREPVFVSGGGGLVGTSRDYLRFCEMLRRGGELDGARLLAPRTIQLMRKNHLPDGKLLSSLAVGRYAESNTQGIGFGLGLASTVDQVEAGSVSQGEYYWGGAASTIFWIDPKEELVVIFMTQLMPSRTFDFRGQLKSLVYSSLVD